LGDLGLALTARSSSGTLYRLRQATFDVFRTSNGSSNPRIPRPPISQPPISSPSFPAADAGAPVLIDPPFFDDDVVVGSGGGSSGGGTAGTGGSGPINIEPPFPDIPLPVPDPGFPFPSNDFFNIQLFSENDPLASTLEATIPIGEYQITLFDGWVLEKVVDGEAVSVEARLVGSSFQTFSIAANEETVVSYRFETNGEVIEFGQGRLIIRIEVEERESLGENARRGAIETSLGALTGFSLRDTLTTALENSGAAASGVTALDAYHAIVDSYSTAELGRDPDAAHCDDELTAGQPSLNGFPLACPRQEAQQFANLDAWFPLAVVNRLDLAPADGANCGQQRMIFANNSPIGNGRMFIIMEAQVPNPNPECGVDACRPIAEFWSSLTEIDDPAQRGQMLAAAFLETGVGPFAPFMNSEHLGPDGGQVRTNNFNDFQWTLREFHFQSAPDVLPLPQPVAEAPNGELWNDLSSLPQGEACRESFIQAMGGLLGDNLSAMSFPVAQECKDAESPNDFFRQDYASHLGGGSGEFVDQMQQALAGTGLSAFDIAARARFAGSCMGCHQEASGSFLGGGLSAPFQGDFVHVSEFAIEDCGDGTACFGLSNALRDVFLPHRLDVQARLLAAPSSCGGGSPGTGGAGGSAGSGGGSSGGEAGASNGGAGGSAGAGQAGVGGGSSTGGAGPQTPPEPQPDVPPSAPIRSEISRIDLSGAAPGLATPRLTLGGQRVVPHGH